MPYCDAVSVFVRAHDGEHACRFFRVTRVVGPILHRLVEVVELEEELLAGDFEATEIVLLVRIVVRREIVERPGELDRLGPDFNRQRADAGRHHDSSAGQRFAQTIVEDADLGALVALDRLVLVGFDLGVAATVFGNPDAAEARQLLIINGIRHDFRPAAAAARVPSVLTVDAFKFSCGSV